MRFDGKVVLITGAAGGFGSRTAEVFADLGARLVLSDLATSTWCLKAVQSQLTGRDFLQQQNNVC